MAASCFAPRDVLCLLTLHYPPPVTNMQNHKESISEYSLFCILLAFHFSKLFNFSCFPIQRCAQRSLGSRWWCEGWCFGARWTKHHFGTVPRNEGVSIFVRCFEELVFQALLESALFNHAKCSNMKSVNCLCEESGSSPSAACPQKKSVLKVTSCK